MIYTCSNCIYLEIDDEGTEDEMCWCNKRDCILAHNIHKPTIPQCPYHINKPTTNNTKEN